VKEVFAHEVADDEQIGETNDHPLHAPGLFEHHVLLGDEPCLESIRASSPLVMTPIVVALSSL
jgi:hypothetical protein